MSALDATAALADARRLALRPRSIVADDGVVLALADGGDGPVLVARADDAERLAAFEGECADGLLVGPTSARNAGALRARLPWLRPRTLGLRGSIGLGDRLGLATPGHVRALRAARTGLAPIFAQQSIREMDRTGRSAQEVVDDATWALFAEGWREPFGADADHLKTPADVDRCLGCGFTFFTIDSGDHVRQSGAGTVRALEAARDAVARYAGRSFELLDRTLTPSADEIGHAAVKYHEVVAHVARMYEHLRAVAAGRDFELEVSVDETDSPTTHAEHVYLAAELGRAGVDWVSLAPRFVGRFEKGIDYIGDVDAFARDFAGHVAIAEALGPYKLSLHSGSDKLSIYPVVAAAAGRRVHVKTSGTSYLEALRVVARCDGALFRRVYACALENFARDGAGYHLTADAERLPPPQAVIEAQLPLLLDDADARRVLHVTFGSVLRGELGPELSARLRAASEDYASALEAHLSSHLAPFA